MDSVLAQTHHPIEVIVVDDGSPGGCEEIVNRVEGVRYVRHIRNRGLFAARLTGIESASGDYIAFVDADDYIAPGMYAALFSQIKKTDADVAQCGAYLTFEDGRKTRDWWFRVTDFCVLGDAVQKTQLAENKLFYIWNKLYRRKLFDAIPDKYHRLDDITMHEDILFSALIFVNVKKLASIQDCYYHYVYRDNAETKSIDVNRMIAQIKSSAMVCELCAEIMKKNSIDDSCAIDVHRLKRRLAGLYYGTKFRKIENFVEKKEVLKNFTEHFQEFAIMAVEDYHESDRLLNRIYKRILPPFSARRYAAKKIFRPIIGYLRS